MYAEPNDLDRALVIDALSTQWGIDVDELRYHPVGFGTHHYIARDELFVNVDDVTTKEPDSEVFYDKLERSLMTARTLRDVGLAFVLAPDRTLDGSAVFRMNDRYAVSVYPFVEGTTKTDADPVALDERGAVLRALGAVHAAEVPTEVARWEEFTIRWRAEFYEAVAGATWGAGPYAQRARDLATSNCEKVDTLFARYDELATVVAERSRFVVTHGEPHPQNVLWLHDGSMRLIDWDTAALGPPERDLWMIEPSSDEMEIYVSAGGVPSIDRDALDMYRLQWQLSEIAVYTKTFVDPHSDDANTQASWREFQKYMAE